MEVATIKVQDRTASGTKQVRRLRDSGIIPLVLYGGGQQSVSLQANYHEVKRHLEHHVRVFKLARGSEVQPGYMQNVQWDCLTDEPLHLDFQRIEMDVPLHMDIELVLLGHPKGEVAGGRLVRDIPYLHLACLPANVPEHVELRITDLDIGDSVFAGEIALPPGCTLDMPADALMLHIADPKREAPEGAEEGVETPAEDAPADPEAQ